MTMTSQHRVKCLSYPNRPNPNLFYMLLPNLGDHDMQVGSTRRGLDQGIIYSGGLGNSTVQRNKGKGQRSSSGNKGNHDSRGGGQGDSKGDSKGLLGNQSQHNRKSNSSSSSSSSLFSSSSSTATSAAAAATAAAAAAEMEGLRTRVIHPPSLSPVESYIISRCSIFCHYVCILHNYYPKILIFE